jgi:hypothetical protein
VVELLRQAVPAAALVVAVDPGKVSNRVWLTSGERGLIGEPVSFPVLREGIDTLAGLIAASGVAGAPRIGVEATGQLRHAWVAELERRWPGSVRLFAPSEPRRPGPSSARAAPRPMIVTVRRWSGWSARAPGGQPPPTRWMPCWERSVTGVAWSPTARSSSSGCMTSSRRCAPGCPPRPGMTAPPRPGRPDRPGRAGLCGRPPTLRSLQARAPGRLTTATARFWVDRWRRLLPPPDDAELRAERLGRDLARHQRLQADIAATEGQITPLLAATPGQILTTLPGVARVRAASFAAHSLPIARFPTPEQLYAATGLAPATWQSASLKRRGRISRQGLPEHRDALRASPGACPNTPRASANATRNSAAAGCAPSRPGLPWPAMPVGSAMPC